MHIADFFNNKEIDLINEGKMNDLDIQRQDWEKMLPVAFQQRYKMSKEQWYDKYKNLVNPKKPPLTPYQKATAGVPDAPFEDVEEGTVIPMVRDPYDRWRQSIGMTYPSVAPRLRFINKDDKIIAIDTTTKVIYGVYDIRNDKGQVYNVTDSDMNESEVSEVKRSQSQRDKESCWPGYRKVGKKASPTHGSSVRVNDCEKIKEEGVTEGQTEGEATLAKIAAAGDEGFEMIYDGINGLLGTEAQIMLQDMYDDVSREYRLHPDDDFEEIQGHMMDRIQDDYGQQGVAEGSDKLQGTPVVSLSDLTDKDNKKNKYGQTVPKKLKKDDPRVKFHNDKKQGVAEVSNNTLKSYQQKVSADSMKHPSDPTKRSPKKANRSVAGFAKAQNRLEKGVTENNNDVDEALKPEALASLNKAKEVIAKNKEADVANREKDFRKNFAAKRGLPSQPATATTAAPEKHSVLKARMAGLDQAIQKQKYLDYLTFKAEQKGLQNIQANIDTSLYIKDGAKDNYQALNAKLDKAIEYIKGRLGITKLAFKKPKPVVEGDKEQKPKIRKYTKMLPDGTKVARYEVLDYMGRRVTGQGTEGFDDLKNAKEFYYRNRDRLVEPLEETNATDTVKMDVPLLLRVMEFAKEDAKTDMDLHKVTEKLVELGKTGQTLTMQDYEQAVAAIEQQKQETPMMPTDNTKELEMKEGSRYWCSTEKRWKDA